MSHKKKVQGRGVERGSGSNYEGVRLENKEFGGRSLQCSSGWPSKCGSQGCAFTFHHKRENCEAGEEFLGTVCKFLQLLDEELKGNLLPDVGFSVLSRSSFSYGWGSIKLQSPKSGILA